MADARPWWQNVAVPIGKVAKDVICVACFARIALARLREVAIKCKFRGRRGSLSHAMKFRGSEDVGLYTYKTLYTPHFRD